MYTTPISLFHCPAELLFVPLIKSLVLFSKSEGKIFKEQWNLETVFIFKLLKITFKQIIWLRKDYVKF